MCIRDRVMESAVRLGDKVSLSWLGQAKNSSKKGHRLYARELLALTGLQGKPIDAIPKQLHFDKLFTLNSRSLELGGDCLTTDPALRAYTDGSKHSGQVGFGASITLDRFQWPTFVSGHLLNCLCG